VTTRAWLPFAAALRSILRPDPDITLIGETRDHETALIAVESALTGHLVLSTLHTNDAPSAVARLTEMGVEPYLTASAMDAVVAQRLARQLCERCREPYQPTEAELAEAGFLPPQFQEINELYRPVGCTACSKTGYLGRIGMYEVMTVTEDIERLTVERASSDRIRQVALEQGMIPLRVDGLQKAARGLTSIEEVLRVVV